MRAEEKLYRDAIEQVWNRGDVSAVDRFFAEDCLGRDALRAIVAIEGLLQ